MERGIAAVWTACGSVFKTWWRQDISRLQVAWTDSGDRLASYSTEIGNSFPRLKWPGVKLITHLTTSARVDNNICVRSPVLLHRVVLK
jgi:hypothetical protein